MGFQDPHPFNFVEISTKTFKADGKTLIFLILFLFFIVLSIFCFLYFIYSCTRRYMFLSRVRTSCPATGGLDKAEIDRLPVVSYGSSHGYGPSKDGECSICLGCFQEGEKVKVLPLCKHGFHSECVDTWLKNRPSCPLCRGSVVRVDSVVHPEVDDVPISTNV
ncbi:RING-H2 finger protein ATL66-like [Impatiens glandulifera]|uniref:RING-H2 finger protein ATL66-like n=1 Tax=Impatiens glandulifera TaxID=253017 RepID=UPI001FB055A6|nr:RING-H2 finger protein ATL66-like [Impatiens glandulifera]